MNVKQKLFVLTGAGISAESGLQTFRGAGGLWRNFRAEELATPEAFRTNPDLVLEFYNERRRQLQLPEVQPNPAHRALARLEAAMGESLTLVTQNVDDLHERGGSQAVLHMHGELLRMRCDACGHSAPQRQDFFPGDRCDRCGKVGSLRPDVVWFGEMPHHMREIMTALEQCDTFVAIGTSGNVYPAAGFAQVAKQSGAHAIEINTESTAQPHDFDEQRCGPAGELVPRWVEALFATWE